MAGKPVLDVDGRPQNLLRYPLVWAEDDRGPKEPLVLGDRAVIDGREVTVQELCEQARVNRNGDS